MQFKLGMKSEWKKHSWAKIKKKKKKQARPAANFNQPNLT